jgi:tetratricopeptide (TPR) repeat protein
MAASSGSRRTPAPAKAVARAASDESPSAARRHRGTLSSQDGASGFGEAYFSIWHRIGRGALFAVAAVVPWLVLPATGTPADAAKLVFAALAATVGLVALLADTIERRKLTYPGSWAAVGVLAVVIATAVSAIFSQSVSISVFGALVLPDALVHTIVAALLFVLAAVFITHRIDVERLAASFLWGISITAFLGILDMLGVPYLLGLNSAGSMSALGFMCVLALGIIAIVPWEELRLFGKVLVVKTAVFSLVALLLLNFMSLWVGLAIVALITAGLAFMRRSSIRLPLIFAVIALAMTLVGSYLPPVGVPRAEIRPTLSSSLPAITSTVASPRAVFGDGPGTYAYTFAAARDAAMNEGPFWAARFGQGASFLVTLPATVGIVGTLAWLFLGIAALDIARRRLGNLVTVGAALGVTLTVIGLAAYPGSFPQIIAGAIALGVLVGWGGSRKSLAFSGPTSPRLLATFIALVVIAAGSLAGAYVVSQKFAASLYAGSGVNALAMGETDVALEKIGRAASLDGSSDAYLRALSQAYLIKFQELSAAENAQEQSQQIQGTFSAAIQAAQQATQVNPADTANWSNLGSIYEGVAPLVEGMGDRALEAYAAAAERDPNGPQWALARARTYVAIAQFQRSNSQPADESYAKAQEAADAALALKADYVDARFVSAQAHFTQGNVEAALKRGTEVREGNPFDSDLAYQLGLLYYQNEQVDAAQAEFLRAVGLNAEFANARYFLGLTWSRKGDVAKALEQFRWLAERNPENEEVKRIISNLEGGRPVLDGVAGEPPVAEPAQESGVVSPENL